MTEPAKKTQDDNLVLQNFSILADTNIYGNQKFNDNNQS